MSLRLNDEKYRDEIIQKMITSNLLVVDNVTDKGQSYKITDDGVKKLAELTEEVCQRLFKLPENKVFEQQGELGKVLIFEIMRTMFNGNTMMLLVFLYDEKNTNDFSDLEKAMSEDRLKRQSPTAKVDPKKGETWH